MKKPVVDFGEIVEDAELRKKEREVTETVKRFFPDCGRVRLFRTADGRIGVNLQVDLRPGERQKLDEAYRAAMKVLGQRRGRPAGVKTVQTKLHLPKPVYSALKKNAERTHETMSRVVTDSLLAHFAAGSDRD